MSPPFQMLEVELGGSPRSRGRCHGEAARPLIHDLITVFTEDIGAASGMHPERIFPHVLDSTGFVDAATHWTPDLIEETIGIAEGANYPFETIMGYQCIQEAVWHCAAPAETSASLLSCTTIGSVTSDGRTILAQTADNHPAIYGRQVILHITDETTGIRSHVLTFPGIVGVYGLNDQGIGLCINEMVASMTHSTTGLPAPFIARGILGQPSFEAADRFVRTLPHASGSNYTIGGPGKVVAYECSANKVETYVPSGDGTITCHTNHPMANDDQIPVDAPEGKLNSATRLAAAERRMRSTPGPITWETVRSALSSHDDDVHPICNHPGREGRSVTCFGIIMECAPEPILHVSSGPPCSTEFRDFAF